MNACFVLGGAKSVWDEFQTGRALLGDLPVIGTNHAGRVYREEMVAWASLETSLMETWVADRNREGHPMPARIVSNKPGRVITDVINWFLPGQEELGSSGLLAVHAAIEFGFDRVYLCGVPLTPDGEHFNYSGTWTAAYTHHPGWVQCYPFLKGKVQSFSGWTAQVFGYPTCD